MLRYKLLGNVQIRGEFYAIVPTRIRQQICNRDFWGQVYKNDGDEKVIHLNSTCSLLNYIKRQAMWSLIHQASIYCINNMIHIWNICSFCWEITKSTWTDSGWKCAWSLNKDSRHSSTLQESTYPTFNQVLQTTDYHITQFILSNEWV